MPSPQQPHRWRTRHRLALFIALFLAISSSLLLRPAPAAAQGTLSCVNKTTSNGVGYAIYGIYASGSTIYAGSVQFAFFPGKLNISTDDGATFIERTTADGLGSSSVRDITVDGGIVYAATPNGLSISTNSGVSFTNKTTANGLGNNQVWGVYAAGSNVYAGTSGGVSISTDGGATFTNKTTADGLGSNAVWGGVYAASGAIYAATNGGLAISTDGGATFSNKTTANGLGSNTVNGVYASGSTVYAATGGGLSISTDGGGAFANKTTADGLGNNSVNGVYVSGNMVYAATSGGLSISTDGGATFTNYTTTNGLVGNAVLRVYVSGNMLYVGISGGLSICTLTLPTGPEINVQGNGVSIPSGDSSPTSADDSDFGSTTVGNSVVRTFTIRNTGVIALTLSGSPLVNVTGNSAFTVSSQPASNSVAAGGSTTFAVTFAPIISGTITATVSIASNDSDETPYTFVVQGAAAGQIDRGDQVTQADYTAVYQPTPQSCANLPAPGLPIHTLTPTLRNNTSNSYQGLYFVVTELGYTVAQSGNLPTLCNADGGNGGSVGARVTATAAVLSDGFNPNESFAQAFQVGLPVRARYRLFVNLYARPATVTAADQGADRAADLIGVLSWEFDENGTLITNRQLFLPLVAN